MVLVLVGAARVARADCVTVGDSAVTVGTAKAAGEYTLALEGQSASATSWGEAGNEALVLEVTTGKRLIGHLILHQGHAKFAYGMHVGALAAGDAVQLRVSPLSASQAKHEATACSVTLAATTDEGVVNAPEFRWPAQKTFNDVPLVVGWSRHDKAYVRPLPEDLDALGYVESSARREALPDRYAPWIYRLSSLELAREHKMDGTHTFAMDRYLYVDVEVSGVAGEGGTYCALLARGGFKLRAVTKKGVTATSAQITAKYAFGGHQGWKRVAIPLPEGVTAADIDHFTFDAYDHNGITLTGLGDAFMLRADGDNGAAVDYVRQGVRKLADFVDDDRAACTDKALTCVGGQVDLPTAP
jgi:hypothetical protein